MIMGVASKVKRSSRPIVVDVGFYDLHLSQVILNPWRTPNVIK